MQRPICKRSKSGLHSSVESKAPCFQEQTAKITSTRRAEHNNGEWVAATLPWSERGPGCICKHLHLGCTCQARTDLEAAECTCSSDFPSFVSGGDSLTEQSTSLLPSCLWVGWGTGQGEQLPVLALLLIPSVTLGRSLAQPGLVSSTVDSYLLSCSLSGSSGVQSGQWRGPCSVVRNEPFGMIVGGFDWRAQRRTEKSTALSSNQMFFLKKIEGSKSEGPQLSTNNLHLYKHLSAQPPKCQRMRQASLFFFKA